MRKNRFLSNIENGSIPDVSVLKERYRSLVMQTHPDRAGASRIGEFIGLEDDYQEALRLLHARRGMTDLREENVRLLFFRSSGRSMGFNRPIASIRTRRKNGFSRREARQNDISAAGAVRVHCSQRR